MKWDEMNIIATHHPPDKDYGHMKIDEPPTPYAKYAIGEEEDGEGIKRRGSVDPLSENEEDAIDPMSIASKLEDNTGPKVFTQNFAEEEDSEDDDVVETEEERAVRKEFENKRKLHYNEFHAMKLAKQLMEQDDEDDDDDGDLDEEAAKNARVNARLSTDFCMDGETSMEGESSGPFENTARPLSVDRLSNTSDPAQ